MIRVVCAQQGRAAVGMVIKLSAKRKKCLKTPKKITSHACMLCQQLQYIHGTIVFVIVATKCTVTIIVPVCYMWGDTFYSRFLGKKVVILKYVKVFGNLPN